MADTNSIALSFEFFPPKTQKGMNNLTTVAKNFLNFSPEYYSVTFGAAGSSRDKTLSTVKHLMCETNTEIAPHISCINLTKKSAHDLLNTYKKNNVKRLVVLRGDIPLGETIVSEFAYASDLVSFIKSEFGNSFKIEVAAYPETHPQTKNVSDNLKFFAHKVKSGANGAITQYFYNPEAYYDFINDCSKLTIDIPIVPGIMPIYNVKQLERFSDICGADLPRWIRKKIEFMQDDNENLISFGIDIVTDLCNKLIEFGAPALHFYTLNKYDAVSKICSNLSSNLNQRMRMHNA